MFNFLGRFVFWTAIFAIAGGIVLHSHVAVPDWIGSWLGQLPGDMWLKKGRMIIYLPLASAAVVSFIFSLLWSLIFKKS